MKNDNSIRDTYLGALEESVLSCIKLLVHAATGSGGILSIPFDSRLEGYIFFSTLVVAEVTESNLSEGHQICSEGSSLEDNRVARVLIQESTYFMCPSGFYVLRKTNRKDMIGAILQRKAMI
jgi:hypothetical protein